MVNELEIKRLEIEIKRLEIESKKKIARKSRLECSYKAFKFINDNIDKISCNHMLSILTIIDNYLVGLEFTKKDIDYSILEKKTSTEYNKLITNKHFIKLKNEYKNKYQKEKEEMLNSLENKFICLINSKKVNFNNSQDSKIFWRAFDEFYYELIALLNVMDLGINHMYFIKNVLLFMKHYGLDKDILINSSNVKEMLIEYDKKVKRK